MIIMSRIGNRILQIPENVELHLNKVGNNTQITVKGPKGELKQDFLNIVKINIDKNEVKTLRENEQKFTKSYHGTVNSIIQGMLIGVTEGYKVELEIKGVGYKATINGNKITMSLGFSHPVEFEIPQGIDVKTPKPTEIVLEGIDKQFVTQFASKIYLTKKPEPYGGKGIRYKGQHVRRKAGKSAGGK